MSDPSTTTAATEPCAQFARNSCPACQGSGYSNEVICRSPVAYRPCRECNGSGISRPDSIAPEPGRGSHVEVPTRLASGKTYCSCGRPYPCAAAVKDVLWRYIDGRNIEARDSQLLNTALGVLQRHATYGECSWHPGEYHGVCSEAAR